MVLFSNKRRGIGGVVLKLEVVTAEELAANLLFSIDENIGGGGSFAQVTERFQSCASFDHVLHVFLSKNVCLLEKMT